MASAADVGVGTTVGSYVLEERIGAGGFGEVFRARHAVIGSQVAIKVLHAKYAADTTVVARFVVEAQAVNRVSHPNIVEIFDFGELGDRHYCVMELLHGKTLRQVLNERTRMPLDEALPILREIAAAVDAAHAAGIAHRDLKPENVFVLDAGSVKLIDFGLAKLVDDAQAPVTATGSMFGTPLYMSPEQCRGKSDARTDLYSFGAMAFHVLTGAPPFTGSPLELALHHLNDPPPRASSVLAELPPHVDRVLEALLAKNPDQRPTPLTAAVAALAGDVKLARRRRWAWLAAPTVLAGLVAGAALWLRGGSAPADACTSHAARIATAWDPARRVALVARFATVDRPDVVATEHLMLSDFDIFAGQWVKQWNASCKTSDRAPLIHAQRQNCLDRALIDFTAVTDAMRDLEPDSFSRSSTGALFAWIRPLEDCDREETLRAMPAAPPPEHTAEVTQLIRAIHTARARARATYNGKLGGTIDQTLGELDQVIAKLDALGAATAAEAAMIRAFYSVNAVPNEPRRLDAAHRSLDRAIALGRKYNYDNVLVDDYHIAIQLELESGRSIPKLHELNDRVAEAYDRAGRPTFVDYWSGRAELSIMEGNLDAALSQLTQGIAQPSSPLWHDYLIGRSDSPFDLYARLATYLGRTDEALMAAKTQLAKMIMSWGLNHQMVHASRLEYAALLRAAGRDGEALDELASARGIATRIANPLLDLSLEEAAIISSDRLGLTKERDAAVARWTNLRPHEDHWLELSDTMDNVGQFALAKSLRAKSSHNEEARWTDISDAVRLEDWNSALAMFDRTPIAKIDQGWLSAAIAIHFGKKATADAYLSGRSAAYSTQDPDAFSALSHDAWILLKLHRWSEARGLIERARLLADRLPAAGVTQLDATEGLALLGLGDAAAARPLLDRALFGMDRYEDDALDIPDTAFALARALVATHGDMARTRRVAKRAIDAYPPFRKADRDAAQAWLAKLPP